MGFPIQALESVAEDAYTGSANLPVGAGSANAVAPMSLALRPHQQATLDEAVAHLRVHDRVTIVLPCGTGKTLLGQRLAQQQASHGSAPILVLVPSLALLRQTVDGWGKHSCRPLASFVFCHDTRLLPDGLRVPVSTSPAALADWVSQMRRASHGLRDPQVVVFATYQSSPRIADAHRHHDLGVWSAVVADEAHHCAGVCEAAFATVVDDAKVPAGVKIFLTATRRVRKTAMQGAFCMDDPAAFGPVVAPLSWRAAIDAELLSDYLVAVVAITDDDIREAINRGSPIAVGKRAAPAERVAVQLALAVAVRNFGLRRIMVFHNSIAESKTFTESLPGVVDGRGVRADLLSAMHVDGQTPALLRAEQLGVLADPGEQRSAVLSNVRCLGEGVDIPALDGVVFAGPRSSQRDIAQCVGRALRLDPNRSEPAVVILPVLVDADGDLDAQVASSRFRHVYRTLVALAERDSELADELAPKSRGRRGSAPSGEECKVVVLGADGAPAADELYKALQLRAMRLLTPSWERGYQELLAYVAEHGDARVPAGHVTATGCRLGAWVRSNRRLRAQMSAEQVRKLEAQPGWAWNLHDAAWWDAYERLRAFIAEHGHARIPRDYRCTDGFDLVQWLSVQRASIAAGYMPADRETALRSVKELSLNPSDDRFQAGLAALKEFVATYGHACPPRNYISPDLFPLGSWTSKVRQRRERLTEEQRAALEAEPGWVWDVWEVKWRAGLAELAAYKEAHGDLQVPRNYITPSGEPLGKWFDTQKSARRAGTLAPHRERALSALDRDWFRPRARPRLKGEPSDPVQTYA